jgi:hydrogenase maturation protease
MSASRVGEKQILVAAVGNLWMRDDGFGSAVATRLRERDVASGVSIADFGSSGLDLAYEVMRGYHALVLVDVSRQGGEPGTLYVMEADPDSVESGIEDGDVIDPHDMDPQTVLRFVKSVNGWPGKVVVVACEPAEIEEPGIGLSPAVAAAVETAAKLVGETIEELQRSA